MKYLHLTESSRSWLPFLLKRPERPGLYQWTQAFNGTPNNTGVAGTEKMFSVNQLNEFDLIHINLAGSTVGLVPVVREQVPKGSHTKIIVNLDFPPSRVEYNFTDAARKNMYGTLIPAHLSKALGQADLIFAQTPEQQTFLDMMIHTRNYEREGTFKGKTVSLIPHPIDTQGVKELRLQGEEAHQAGTLAYMYHPWDPHYVAPSVMAFAAEYLVHMFYNTKDEFIPNMWFHSVSGPVEWLDYIDMLKRRQVGFDYYTVQSADRFILECACLEVPAVATSCSYFATQCFPDLICDYWDFKGIIKTLRKLNPKCKEFEEPFYQQVTKQGFERVENWGWQSSVDRMIKALKEWELL